MTESAEPFSTSLAQRPQTMQNAELSVPSRNRFKKAKLLRFCSLRDRANSWPALGPRPGGETAKRSQAVLLGLEPFCIHRVKWFKTMMKLKRRLVYGSHAA